MAVPIYGHARPVIIVGPLGVPVVILNDKDDNAIAEGQLTALTIVENYFDDIVGGMWRRWWGTWGNAVHSELVSVPNVRDQILGFDPLNAAGSQIRPIMAEPPMRAAAVDERWIALRTRAFANGLNSIAGAGAQGVAIEARGVTSVSASWAEASFSLLTNQSRESGFAAAWRGKRFYATNQTPGTLVTAQVAFVATTPTLMLRVDSAAIRDVVRSLDLCLVNTPGGLG